jgi:protein involved in polysaccharide export with SLBB domain
VAAAQQPVTYGDGRRAQATRAELEASLQEIAQIMASPGYSARLRENRRREAELIRERLEEGDLQVGDQINLTVVGEDAFTGTFLIGSGRVLSLPGVPDIPLRGVLRSEAQAYLTEQLRRQLRDPRLQVRTNIRLTFTGAVGRPGFYQVPADIMATDAVMSAAAGFAGGGDPNRMLVRRQGREIWNKEAFQDAILRGMTLDQMNLRTGDEIVVEARPRAAFGTIMAGIGALSSVAYLLVRLF